MRTVAGASVTSRGDQKRGRTGEQGLDHRPGLDHLAEVDRARLLDGLPDGRFSKRRRTQALVAGIHPQELDRARQPIVQSGPPLLDAQRDVEIVKPDEERPDDPPIREPDRRTGKCGQQALPGSRSRAETASRLAPARITSGTSTPTTHDSPWRASMPPE